MYVRQISRKRSDGTRVRYLQLAHKVRDPETGTPKDDVLYHFGREDKIDKAQLKRLVRSLSRFLNPEDRAEIEAGLEGLGTDLAAQKSLSYGGSYVLDNYWKRLELCEVMKELLCNRSFQIAVERLLFALVSNRALDPRSKLAIERWVGRKVVIDGLDEVSVHALYRAMDFLAEHDEEIQRAVFFSVATLLNLEVDLLFFDITSIYFEIEEEDVPEVGGVRRFGHSKDRRPDLPQVVIGLAVTRSGIPVRCWVLPGNTADASTVEMVQRDLAGWKLNRVVWVVDRGFTGKDQRVFFQRGGGQLIMGEKLRNAQGKFNEALLRPGRYKKVRDNLEVKEITVENGSEEKRYVVVKNLAEAVRDKKKRNKRLTYLEAELDHLNKGRKRRGNKHNRAICTLKSHRTYGRYIRELKNGKLKIDRAQVRADEKLDGKYLLSTTDPSLSSEDVALGYKQLIDVERAFRTLKHTLDLRPVHHRLPDRIRCHVLLCWLALLLVRIIENDAGMSWEKILDELSEICLVILRGKDGTIQVCTELTPIQRKLLKKLKIKPPKQVRKVRLSS